MAVESNFGSGDFSGVANALELAATAILLELAIERGKGPWFGALLLRLQLEISRTKAPDGAPDSVKERWIDDGTGAVDEIFRSILLDPAIPDWRHDAALSGDGVPNRLLVPAVASGYRILAETLAEAVRNGPDGQERLRLLSTEAVGKAEVQTVPGDTKSVLKDRWVGASVTAIESVVIGRRGADDQT